MVDYTEIIELLQSLFEANSILGSAFFLGDFSAQFESRSPSKKKRNIVQFDFINSNLLYSSILSHKKKGLTYTFRPS